MSKKQATRKQTTNTIDTIHQKKMQSFNKETKQLSKMKKRIKEITFLLDEFNEESNSQPIVKVRKSRRGRKKKVDKEKESVKMKSTSTIKTYDEYYTLLDEKKNLMKRVEKIESQDDITNYYLENGELIFQYYDQKQNPNFMKKKRTSHNAKKSMKKDSILYYLMKNKKEPDNKDDSKKKSENEDDKKTENTTENNNRDIDSKDDENDDQESLNATIKKGTGVYKGMLKYIGKNDVIDKYMRKMDPNYQIPLEYNENIDFCENCKCNMTVVHSEGIIRCEKCGLQEDILIDSDKPSYKDPPRELSFYSYKKLNHLAEWIAQFQAKETTEIPKEVFDGILNEIKKERITNMAKLTNRKMRKILRKLGYSKYYEHIPHIKHMLGIPAPVINRETDEALRSMFKEIQAPFLRHCPPDRLNFLSYSYILHKFFLLLKMSEFCQYFPLLRSREKLHAHDVIWKKICADLGWKFHRSL